MGVRIGIFGYGRLAMGVEAAVLASPDMTLTAIFTHRNPVQVAADRLLRQQAADKIPPYPVPVVAADRVMEYTESIDVLILCGGSATDLPQQTPQLAAAFCVVDSFDCHAAFRQHFSAVDRQARSGGKLALVGAGWDPGIFSAARAVFEAILPAGQSSCFWGPGVSLGHSQAVRALPGVEDACALTLPRRRARLQMHRGKVRAMSPQQWHRRRVYVVPQKGASRAEIKKQICRMPDYFVGYATRVRFCSADWLHAHFAGLPHAGLLLRESQNAYINGVTENDGYKNDAFRMELRLKMRSNPAFTGSILAASARALWRMAQRGEVGCRAMPQIAPADLSALTWEAFCKTGI